MGRERTDCHFHHICGTELSHGLLCLHDTDSDATFCFLLCVLTLSPGSKPDYFRPCCIKAASWVEHCAGDKLAMQQRFQFNAFTRGMVCFDECSELKTALSHRSCRGRVMLPGKAASWLCISPKQHWDMLSSGSSGKRRKIMSQTKSRVTLLCRVYSCCNIHKQNTSWKWAIVRLCFFFPFFFSFFSHLNVCRRYSLSIKWQPQK